MDVFIHHQDIFELTRADTLVLPIDGTRPGNVGSLAQQAMKRFGVDELAGMLAPPPYYPMNGEPCWSSLATFDTHFDWVCCIDTLRDEMNADHQANLRRGLHLAFDGMSCGGVGESLACPLLTGGTQVDPANAARQMLAATKDWESWPFALHIVEQDPERFAVLQQINR